MAQAQLIASLVEAVEMLGTRLKDSKNALSTHLANMDPGYYELDGDTILHVYIDPTKRLHAPPGQPQNPKFARVEKLKKEKDDVLDQQV